MTLERLQYLLDRKAAETERVVLQETVSTLRALADEAEGAVTVSLYRDLIQLFENREAAARAKLNLYIDGDVTEPA